MFELRQKFRYFSLKTPKKQTVVRQLSSCISEKYNGFHVVSIDYSHKLRKKFSPINIIYKPVKSNDENSYVIIQLIYQKPTEILVELQKKFLAYMHLSVITVVNILVEQTNKNAILKVVGVFLGLFIILIIKILLLLRITLNLKAICLLLYISILRRLLLQIIVLIQNKLKCLLYLIH